MRNIHLVIACLAGIGAAMPLRDQLSAPRIHNREPEPLLDQLSAPRVHHREPEPLRDQLSAPRVHNREPEPLRDQLSAPRVHNREEPDTNEKWNFNNGYVPRPWNRK